MGITSCDVLAKIRLTKEALQGVLLVRLLVSENLPFCSLEDQLSPRENVDWSDLKSGLFQDPDTNGFIG